MVKISRPLGTHCKVRTGRFLVGLKTRRDFASPPPMFPGKFFPAGLEFTIAPFRRTTAKALSGSLLKPCRRNGAAGAEARHVGEFFDRQGHAHSVEDGDEVDDLLGYGPFESGQVAEGGQGHSHDA